MTSRTTAWLAWSLFALSATLDVGGGALLSLTPANLRASPLLWPETQ